MKKILSTVMLLLVISSNFFCYTFANNVEGNELNEINTESMTSLQGEKEEIVNSEELEEPSEDDFSETQEINDKSMDNNNEELIINNKEILEASELMSDESLGDNSDSSSNLELEELNNDEEQEGEEPKFKENLQIENEETRYVYDDCDICDYCYDDEDCILFCTNECSNEEGSGDNEDIELPNLVISEVFFGGNNERIEVYNAGNDFKGDLVLSGIYNGKGTRFFSNVLIENGETKIFGNPSAANVLGNIEYIVSDPTLRIGDSANFLIQLYYSGELLDLFVGNANLADSNTSFHRIISTNKIMVTTSGYSQNVSNNFLANPGYVFLQENEPTNPDDPEEPGLTGDVQETPNLKITEIYFDGDDNRFEITNLGNNDFSGNLTLNGNLNFTISTQIPAGISKVFSNSLTMFQSGENIEIIENNISFGNERIDLDLVWSGEILDTFFVHESRVDYLQEYETSFEKVGYGSNWTTTYVGLSDRRHNIRRGIAANPTTYFTQGENMKDVTKDRNGNEIYTGENYDLPIDCDDFWNDYTATISEVYYGNSTYPSYVELKIDDDISDYNQIFLSGSAVSSPVYFNTIGIKKNTFVLLTKNSTWYNEGRESKENSGFNLNSSGWLILYGIDSYGEDILDIIYISRSSAGNSVYLGSESLECVGVFDYTDKFSPGLTIGQSQFIQITPDPIIQYIHVGGGGGSCPNNETPIFSNSTISSSEIQISAIKYFGNKQILKLKNKTNSDINLHEYSLQFLDGSTRNVQGNTLFAKSTMSFVGNYGLSINQDFCVNLMKDGEVVDRYCRNSLTKATAQDEENILNQLTFREELDSNKESEEEEEQEENPNNTGNNENLLQTNLIKIIDIDYDPAGADGDNESVTLLLLTGDYVDLSGYNFSYIKDGKTQKAKAKIQGILSFGIKQTFKGGFAFPNSTEDKKPVTVNLLGPDGKLVDTYIYNPNKITEIPAGNYEVLSVIDGDTIKINYDSQEITVRLAGIDAPESSALRCGKVECFGPEAKQYLKDLIEGETISFEPASMDGYDRFVGYIFLNGENINEKIVKDGYAREYSYKNQNYKYQSQFKSAQNYARNNSLGLRGNQCKGDRLCPVDETQMEYDFLFNIENIIYDPEGNDNGNEEIWIKMIDGVTTEFGTDFYLLVNDTKKSLKKYGSISPGETKKLIGTFGFPNNKLTTVSLLYNGKILDTYVYNPDELVDTGSILSTGDEILDQISQFSILSILPNPFGADGSNEEVELFCKSELPRLNLSSGFYLQIGTTKKYLKGEITTNENITLKGAFSFPNKGGCVELGYKGFIFDKFCYSQPDEGQKFYVSNGVIESISTLDLSILKNSKLQNIGNKVCLTYAGQNFSCKNMPYSKLSTKKINQNKLYKNFFDEFEGYLKENWKIMYYDSEIKNYFELLNEIEDVISEGGSTITIEGIKYETSDFASMYQNKYHKTSSQFLFKIIKSIIPGEVFNKYEQLKSEYIELLRQS